MKIGKFGEDIAKEYLIKNKFNILETNYHSKYGEIDIICENFEYIVFVEVKTKLESTYSVARERVDYFKKNKFLKTIGTYILENKIIKNPRIDVIEVILKNDGFLINHIENAFGV